MSIKLAKKNQLDLKCFIKLLKPFSICCGVVAIAGLAVYPLIDNNLAEKVEDKVEKNTSVLSPASYTIILDKNNNEAIIKFHNQESKLHLKNINVEQYNCLLNGGGVNCILASVYQPQIKATKNIDKSTFQAETKHKSLGISIDKDTMDNLAVIVGVILGFLLIKKFI